MLPLILVSTLALAGKWDDAPTDDHGNDRHRCGGEHDAALPGVEDGGHPEVGGQGLVSALR